MGPIDYRLNIPDPTQSVLGAAQGMGQLALTQRAAQWSAEDRAKAQQEAEAQKQAQLAQQKALYDLSQNPTPENITRTMVRYPALAEHLQKAHGNASEAQTQNIFSTLGPIASALQSGNRDVANALMERQKAAMENANNPQGAAAIGNMMQLDDKALSMAVTGRLYAADPKRFETMFKVPAEVAKIGAETEKTGAEAKQVAPLAKAEIGLKGAQAGKAVAETGKTREETVTERVLRPAQVAKVEAQAAKERAEVEKLTGAGGNSQELATRVGALVGELVDPKAEGDLESITGPVYGSRPVWSMSQAGADLNAKLATIKSDAFLSQVAMMKGTGSLTDAEGAKLESAIASLDRSQSVGQLQKNLKEIKSTMDAAAERAAKRASAPAEANAQSVIAAARALISGGK